MVHSKARIIDILVQSFYDNKSTNFVLKQDRKKDDRIRNLMEYSYFQGQQYGRIYLSDDENACAIVLFPGKKKSSLAGLGWTFKLVFGTIGLFRVGKVSNREALIKKHHPKTAYAHLWFVGVDPKNQGQGLGTKLVQQIMEDNKALGLPTFLETSNPRNFPFYEKLGFEKIAELDSLGYGLRMYLG